MPEGPQPITEYISKEGIGNLREQFKPEEMDEILRGLLPKLYPASQEYVDAVNNIFFTTLPPDEKTGRTGLSAADRERCIIALLASRGEGFNLGLHIYMALMAGVWPEEIAHIILLAGIYGGVEHFTNALNTEVETLKVLQKQVTQRGGPTTLGAKAVFGALRATLQPPHI